MDGPPIYSRILTAFCPSLKLCIPNYLFGSSPFAVCAFRDILE